MNPSHAKQADTRSRLAFGLLAGFLIVLWIAGGASRADVSGQVVVRALAWLFLVIGILVLPRPDFRPVRAAALLLGACVLIVAAQLVPLPPVVWMALPGRDLLAQAAQVIGQPQPWRPLSMSPSGTMNALSSLIVPVVTLVLAAGLRRDQHKAILALLLGLAAASTLVALAQFSGMRFANPFINNVAGSISGTFANRNHFALFAALGLLLAFAWAFEGAQARRWRAAGGLGLSLLFILIILASGSRTGLVLGLMGIALGIAMTRTQLRAQMNQLPPRYAIGFSVAAGAALVAVTALSIFFDRAVAVDRASELQSVDDLRVLALPTILQMTADYFPFGSGFGTFDPVYRISEQSDLLGMRYLNHAHNDWLEAVLEGGLASIVLLIVAVSWWAWRSWQAWLGSEDGKAIMRRAGSAIVLMVFIASATDYPARTPLVMSALTLAAIWLGFRGNSSAGDDTRTAERRSAN